MEKYIEKLSLFIFNWLNIDNKLNDDKELYLHSITLILYDFVNFSGALIIGVFFNVFIETLIFLLAFCSIRKYSGGFHASSHIKCFLEFQIIHIVFILFYKFIPLSRNSILVLSFLAYIYICLNSPLQHISNPLSDNEIIINRKKARYISTIIMIVVLFINLQIKKVIMLSMVVIVILMIILKYSKDYIKGGNL